MKNISAVMAAVSSELFFVSKGTNYKHSSYSYPYCDLVTNYIYAIVRVFVADCLTRGPKMLCDACIVISLLAYSERIFGSPTVSYEITTISKRFKSVFTHLMYSHFIA
jgi:hypothetical protein